MDSSNYVNSYVPSCIFVLDKEQNISGQDKLNTLDNTQECLSNSHHKIAFDYDEDTPLNISEI